MILWDDVAERLEDARRQSRGVVIATHVNADGDGLGSEIGLDGFLRSKGHQVAMINNDPVPKKYQFLRGSDRIMVYDERRGRELIQSAAVFFVLDNSSPARLGRLLPAVEASKAFRICIDHHTEIEPFWHLNCVDTDAAASGQLVYQAIRTMGGEITPEIAEALYVSFVTDTGHFRFSKTTPEVHRIIADLMEKGRISPAKVYRALFEGVSPGLISMVGWALSDARYEYGGRFAWARLTRRQLDECKGDDEDTGDLVNMLLAVEGVRAAAIFKEMPEGRTKVSLRSLGEVDVSRLAMKLGGGGHKNASGILMTAPFDEGIRAVVDGMKEVLGPS